MYYTNKSGIELLEMGHSCYAKKEQTKEMDRKIIFNVISEEKRTGVDGISYKVKRLQIKGDK